MKNSLLLAVNGMLLFTAVAMTACTTVKTNQLAKSDQITVDYVYPEKPEHRKIYEELKKRESLENLEEFLSPFRLEWPLTISLDACDGEADASYSYDTITICYEYIEELLYYMPSETTPSGIEPFDMVVGPFMDTILHEFAPQANQNPPLM